MSIRFKLMLSLVLGYTLIASILHFEWIPTYMEHAESSFINNQRDILGTLAPSVIPALLERDYANLYGVLDHTMAINGDHWVSLTLHDANGRRLYPLAEPVTPVGGALIGIERELAEHDESVGRLNLAADWSVQARTQELLVYRMELTILAVFTVVALVSMFLQRSWIFNPLVHLQHAAQQLSHGDFGAVLPAAGPDEIGDLSRAFTEMRDSVHIAQADLQQALRESRQSEARLQAILDSASDAIISVSADGKIETFNLSAETTFGCTFTDAIGTPIDDLATFDCHSSELLGENLITQAQYTDRQGNQLKGQRRDGSMFPLEYVVARIKESDPVRYIFTMRDITERKRSEIMKDEFVSAVSHELRTPLTAISGAVALIMHNPNDNLSEQSADMLVLAERNIRRLLTLIGDLLDISKLESGAMQFNLQHMQIQEFLEETVRMNQTYAEKFGVSFVIGQVDDATVITDSERLGQVISNLLSNAAKFSTQGCEVEVSATIHGEQIRIDVADCGPGIPIEFQDKLFEKFTQYDSGNTRSVGSTGLGLSISRSLLTKLGGKISFDTVEEEGTTFHVDLPLGA